MVLAWFGSSTKLDGKSCVRSNFATETPMSLILRHTYTKRSDIHKEKRGHEALRHAMARNLTRTHARTQRDISWRTSSNSH
eukprot:6168688-Pleurochrysis_carterae.AAC.1